MHGCVGSPASGIRDSLLCEHASESLPTDLAAAHAMILAARAGTGTPGAVGRRGRCRQGANDRIVLDLELERLRFQLAKARREAFGPSSEAGARIGQLELALEDIEETLAAMRAADQMADATVEALHPPQAGASPAA